MVTTNSAGVVVEIASVGTSAQDAATQILQSGLLDEDEYEPRISPANVGKKAEVVEEGETEPDSEESDDEQPVEEPDDDTETENDEAELVEDNLYTVKVAGKVQNVTLDELKNGYQRGTDYTHKTQELSENRRNFDAERQAVQIERVQYHNALQQFKQILAERNAPYENIDWEDLAEIDPAQYVTKKEEQRDLRDRAAQVQIEQARIQQMQAQETHRQRTNILQAEGEHMAKTFPDWSVPEKKAKLAQAWTDFALGLGYSDEDVKAISDHRAFKVLDMAMKYERIQAATVKKNRVLKASKTVQPGSPRGGKPLARKGLDSKMKQLRGSGRVDDAASIFFDMDF